MSLFKLSASEALRSIEDLTTSAREATRWPHRSAPWKPEYRNGLAIKAESFMRTTTRGSPSWLERMLRGRLHYCRLIETNSQKSTCRSGAGHTFGTHTQAPTRVRANLPTGCNSRSTPSSNHQGVCDGQYRNETMNNLFECGLALRRQVLGPEGVRCWDRNMSTDRSRPPTTS
jgi:hypothetical protein